MRKDPRGAVARGKRTKRRQLSDDIRKKEEEINLMSTSGGEHQVYLIEKSREKKKTDGGKGAGTIDDGKKM